MRSVSMSAYVLGGAARLKLDRAEQLVGLHLCYQPIGSFAIPSSMRPWGRPPEPPGLELFWVNST